MSTPVQNAPAQHELWAAEKVATHSTIATAPNGLRFSAWGQTRIAHAEMERLVGAVPRALAPALSARCYYFVPLVMAEGENGAEGGTVFAAPDYSADASDRAICHRNTTLGLVEAVFISTRLVEDRFGLSFEFAINVAHNFVDAVGVPESFGELVWSQALAAVRGETSQEAWDARRRAIDPSDAPEVTPAATPAGIPAGVDERARKAYQDAAFADAVAIYILSLAIDFDYHDLREREYPLLAAPALAERLRHIARLFPANDGYEFQILYRRRG